MPEADHRAATTLGSRLPAPPALQGTSALAASPAPEPAEEASLYQRVAADLRGAIDFGVLAEGDPIPTLNAIAKKYGVAVGTAQRAVALLASSGNVIVRSGRRTVVAKGA